MLKENCKDCLQPIINPICESCFIRQISAWLKNIDMTAMPRSIIISQLRKNISPDSMNEQECVICGNHVDICPHCFVLKTSKLFKKIGLTSDFVQSFHAIFSYHQSARQSRKV